MASVRRMQSGQVIPLPQTRHLIGVSQGMAARQEEQTERAKAGGRYERYVFLLSE
ncbi:hypothetical protein [Paenibacillus glycanilyticus]|uniref:hypothetical protein n=1 Tax=Paenibacillus glycanilyticus TaxID=126569 RepID=UPI001910B170|nr:hypothetical protein [Paenibacillus glycanilyticus]